MAGHLAAVVAPGTERAFDLTASAALAAAVYGNVGIVSALEGAGQISAEQFASYAREAITSGVGALAGTGPYAKYAGSGALSGTAALGMSAPVLSSFPSSISYVDGASYAGATVSIPAHAPGDLLVAFAFRGTSTTPSIPSGGWNTATENNNYACGRLAWKWGDGTDTSITMTNATGILVVIYRGTTMLGYKFVEDVSNGDKFSENLTEPTYIEIDVYASFTPVMIHSDSTSWGLRVVGAQHPTDDLDVAPDGILTPYTTGPHTLRTGIAAEVAAFDSDGGVTAVLGGSHDIVSWFPGWCVTWQMELIQPQVHVTTPDPFWVSLQGAKQVAVGVAAGEALFRACMVNDPVGIAMYGDTLYVASGGDDAIYAVDGSGITEHATVTSPSGMVVDSSGNLFVLSGTNGTVIKVTPAGATSTFYTLGSTCYGITIDSSDNVYLSVYSSAQIKKITPAGSASTFYYNATVCNSPTALACDSSNNIYVSAGISPILQQITQAGSVLTYLNLYSTYTYPVRGMAFDSSGYLYFTVGSDDFAESNGKIYRRASTSAATLIADGLGTPHSILFP